MKLLNYVILLILMIVDTTMVLAYCNPQENKANYEWIEEVTIGASTNYSGRDNGYADFTNDTIEISTHSNLIKLVPGFKSGTYQEYWKVWVDLNDDGNFSEDEIIFSANGTGTVYGSFSLPNIAFGIKTLRVAMNYGSLPLACEPVVGEVEDYLINISSSDDLLPPAIISTYPENKEENVIITSSISIEFSESIDTTSITTNSLIISDDYNNTVLGSFVHKDNTVIFTPSVALQYNQIYSVVLTTNAKDQAGNILPADYRWTFKTESKYENKYCKSYAANSSYEWIESVVFGQYEKESGQNDGYAQFSDVIELATGENTFKLTPGFAQGNYEEFWTIYIDLNHDSNFTEDELIFTGASSTIIDGKFTIPSSTLKGQTGMRIALQYGNYSTACQAFSYGEVEDYIIEIK